MKFNWEIKLSDVVHILVVLGALIAMYVSFNNWRTSVDIRIADLESSAKEDIAERTDIKKLILQMEEHLNYMEGKLNIIH